MQEDNKHGILHKSAVEKKSTSEVRSGTIYFFLSSLQGGIFVEQWSSFSFD